MAMAQWTPATCEIGNHPHFRAVTVAYSKVRRRLVESQENFDKQLPESLLVMTLPE